MECYHAALQQCCTATADAQWPHQHGCGFVQTEAVKLHHVAVEAHTLQDVDLLALQRRHSTSDQVLQAAGARPSCYGVSNVSRSAAWPDHGPTSADSSLSSAQQVSCLIATSWWPRQTPRYTCAHRPDLRGRVHPRLGGSTCTNEMRIALCDDCSNATNQIVPTLPKLPAPSTQAWPSGCWQISTSAGGMAMELAVDGVLLALQTGDAF